LSNASATTETPLRLVAIGDSIAQASSCSGCTDFVDLYGQAVSNATGRRVDVDNRAAIELSALPPVEASGLLNDLLVDQGLRASVASADIVLINVGFNDTPWNRIDNPCEAANLDVSVIRWARITAPCIARVSSEYAQTLDQVLGQVDELRGCFTPPGAPAGFCASVGKRTTLLRLVTVYDDWIGEHGVHADGVDATAAADRAFVAAQCWVMAEHGGRCADAYHALNGPTGTADAAPFLVDDHTHLNQSGHERVAETLSALGYAPLR
jgi:lysophospholipase L1-like esterase